MYNSRPINQRITSAISATKEIIPGYLEKTLQSRLLATGCGSVFVGFENIDDLSFALENAHWEPYTHKNLLPETTAFLTRDLHGYLGVVDLSTLPDSAEVVLDDRKNTGNISCTVRGILGPKQDFSVLILGMEQNREVVFTVHPGAPVRPSTVKCETGMHGKCITAKEALKMGLSTAKIVR